MTDRNRFGTSPFYFLHGPGIFNLDLALARNFRLSERFNLQFRAQAINFTNPPHFGNPEGDINSFNFGRVNSLANTGRATETWTRVSSCLRRDCAFRGFFVGGAASSARLFEHAMLPE